MTDVELMILLDKRLFPRELLLVFINCKKLLNALLFLEVFISGRPL